MPVQERLQEPVQFDERVIGAVADQVAATQLGIVAEEASAMEPLLAKICSDLGTISARESASGDSLSLHRRAVGFSAAHRIVRLSAGERIGRRIQAGMTHALNYTDAVMRVPSYLGEDFGNVYPDEPSDRSALHRFVVGELHPDDDRGHGCTFPASRYAARLMFVLAGSIGSQREDLIMQTASSGGRSSRETRRYLRILGA